MTDATIIRADFGARPRRIISSAVWGVGPDPADSLPTSRALSEAVERFSLHTAGVRAHVSQAAMLTDPELYDKHAVKAIEFARDTIEELRVIIALLSGNNEPGDAA